jgi:creatinine amidohydrolase/Fe(II)-dependent formamide hydrolase-like protein
MMRTVLAAFTACLVLFAPVGRAAADSLFLEELTSTEVRDAIRAGKTTIIIPVGGTEQNGPHMALGKHNARGRLLAGRIAGELGNALVAPVVAYVPEGSIAPPSGHMRFAGTISVPDAAFRGVLEGAARSFRQHGFTDVVLVGEHGGYQGDLKAVAAKLNLEWKGTPARAHFIEAYYRATQDAYVKALRDKGLTDVQIGTHAGAADTALTMAVDPALVRPAAQMPATPAEARANGVSGDPRLASAVLGRAGLDLVVAESVAAIRKAQATSR